MPLHFKETTRIALESFAKTRGLTTDQALRFLLKAYLLPRATEDDLIEGYARRNRELIEAIRAESSQP